ncbi:MAG: TRAP transporter small permease [Ruminococcaceae bacterium]|nr:TRAP transporter small permease [Oscillospiraceae bacterium]
MNARKFKWQLLYLRMLDTFSAVLMFLLVIIVLYSVFSRYILNSSIAWAEELSRFLMVWMICIGAVTAYYHHEHLGLDLLVKLFPKLSASIAIIQNVAALVTTAIMTLGGWQLMRSGLTSVSPSLRVNMGYIYIILPAFSAVLFFMTLCRLIALILFRKEE